jgi:hypothetical protein
LREKERNKTNVLTSLGGQPAYYTVRLRLGDGRNWRVSHPFDQFRALRVAIEGGSKIGGGLAGVIGAAQESPIKAPFPAAPAPLQASASSLLRRAATTLIKRRSFSSLPVATPEDAANAASDAAAADAATAANAEATFAPERSSSGGYNFTRRVLTTPHTLCATPLSSISTAAGDEPRRGARAARGGRARGARATARRVAFRGVSR